MDNEESKAGEPENKQDVEAASGGSEGEGVGQDSEEGQGAPGEGVAEQEESGPGKSEEQGGEEEVQAEESDADLTSLVRYGRMNMLGEFARAGTDTLAAGTKVVVRTERGIELGQIVLGFCEGKGCMGVSREKWQTYLSRGGEDQKLSRSGRIVRTATEQDLADQEHLNRNSGEKLEFCQKLVNEMGLDMQMVDVEHLFGGDRVLFYFKSEKRVDFRRLVRRLAKEYQTRIEMRQVGARDEARLLADYERCGRECCCRSFLKHLAPVNMRMAKVQKATLDPAKISGRCSRLMCCLRYEHSTYEELRKKLPTRNSAVNTPEGEGVVVDRQILTQLLIVRLADAKRVAFPASEVTVVPKISAKEAQKRKQREAEAARKKDDPSSEGAVSEGDQPQGGAKRRRRNKQRGSNRPQQQ